MRAHDDKNQEEVLTQQSHDNTVLYSNVYLDHMTAYYKVT